MTEGAAVEGHGSTRADSSPLALSSLARSSRCADKTYCCSVKARLDIKCAGEVEQASETEQRASKLSTKRPTLGGTEQRR